MKSNVHEGHRDRLRAKIAEHGLPCLADHEKLEYLLYPFVPRRDTNPIAHELIQTFGSLKRVFEADVADLVQVKGVSRNAALFLHNLPSLFSGHCVEPPKRILNNTQDAARYAISVIGGERVERFVCFFLDDDGAVIKISDLASGAKKSVSIHREELARLAVQCKAKIVVLSHNHPSGELYPSREDVLSTNRLAQTLRTVGVRLWDHIIVSATDSFSMCDHALIEAPAEFESSVTFFRDQAQDKSRSPSPIGNAADEEKRP